MGHRDLCEMINCLPDCKDTCLYRIVKIHFCKDTFLYRIKDCKDDCKDTF